MLSTVPVGPAFNASLLPPVLVAKEVLPSFSFPPICLLLSQAKNKEFPQPFAGKTEPGAHAQSQLLSLQQAKPLSSSSPLLE